VRGERWRGEAWANSVRGRREKSLTRFAGAMTYRVELTERAARDPDILYVEKHATGSPAAACWYNRIEEAVYRLERSPYRSTAAPQAEKSRRPLRHLLYGRKPHVYRVIYEIDEKRQLATVITIRHGAQEPAELSE